MVINMVEIVEKPKKWYEYKGKKITKEDVKKRIKGVGKRVADVTKQYGKQIKAKKYKKVVSRKVLRKQKPVTVRLKENKPAEYRSLYFKKEWADAQKF